MFIWLYSDFNEFHWAISSWSLQFLECLCRQSERACETLHARSSLPPPSIMQQYINHHRHHHHHAWSRRVFSPFRSFHPNLESPDWFMCLVQYFLVVPAVIDFKQWSKSKEFKEAYQWQRGQKWLFVQHDAHSHTGYVTLYREGCLR